MNIQIYGKNKCFNSKAAERFFKERKIKYQFINVLEKGLSKKELENVLSYVKDIDLLFDVKSSAYEKLNVAYIKRSIDDKKELLFNNFDLINTPVVRDCDSKKCSIGSAESVWKSWLL